MLSQNHNAQTPPILPSQSTNQLFASTKDKPFQIGLRASSDVVVPVLFPDLPSCTELIAQMAKEEVQVLSGLVSSLQLH